MSFILYPTRLREYLVELKANIPEIEKTFVLADPSEVANFVKEHLADQSIAVFGLIPDIDSESKNIDALQFTNTLGFRVVERTDYSSLKDNEEWLNVFQRTLEVAEKIIIQLSEDASDSAFCLDFKGLEASSFSIRPIWHLAHCNGWDVEFQIKKYDSR